MERNQPYLYCVTLVEGSHTTSAAMGSEAAPFQRHPGQQAAAAGAEGYSYPPQLPLGTATAIYGCNIPCMASSAGLATMGVTQAAVEHTSGLARVIEVGCAPGAWQSHDGMAGIGSGGGGRGGSGGSSGASAGPRQTNQHGEYSSLSVGSGILPGCKFLAGTQPSFEVRFTFYNTPSICSTGSNAFVEHDEMLSKIAASSVTITKVHHGCRHLTRRDIHAILMNACTVVSGGRGCSVSRQCRPG